MARITDTLLSTGDSGQAYGANSLTPQVNIAHENAGSMGYAPDYEGIQMNSAYVRRPAFCLVLESPRGFNDLGNPEVWHKTFKHLMERGTRTITGLNATVNVEYVENEFGGAGEMLSDIGKVTRERSIPVHTHIEKYGMPTHGFYDGWINLLIGNPETGVPGVVALNDADGGPTDLLLDYTGATCIYVELDPLHKTVVKAFLLIGMMPDTSGEYIADRDITQSPTSTEHSITFTGVQMVGAGPKALAQKLVDEVSLNNANVYRRKAPIDERSADVKAATNGYQEQISRIPSEKI